MAANPLQRVPAPHTRRLAIRVKPAAERALRQGHPWLFEGAITQISGKGVPGDIAVVFNRRGRFLAAGLYDPESPIRVRLLVHNRTEEIGPALFSRRLVDAAARRASLPSAATTGYRLLHGANEGMAGLVIDRYGESLVWKLDTAAWVPHLPQLLEIVTRQERPERIVLRLGRHVQLRRESLFGLTDGQILLGEKPLEPVPFLENGLHFAADLLHGQKTGFFLDQRENRSRVEGLGASCSVLNVFAYSGAFSLYAARGGATAVTSLDQSAPALAAAERHFAINAAVPGVRAARHDTLQGDAFRLLGELAESGQRYDLVIIDPPSFARRRREVSGALNAYARLTLLGLAMLKPGGTLVISSCSSRVTFEQFFETVTRTAREVGRPLKELERTGHAVDHPIGFKEGAYLKTIFAVAP
ncbi:MAG: class I SAM-dependent rRNA methyltransferase [Candidatus Promineifilaceae bacterium]